LLLVARYPLMLNAGLCGDFGGAKRRKNRPATAPG
jgi:hypothetical protein